MVKGDWTLHRRPFFVTNSTNKNIYQAQVDGFLRLKANKQPGAIIEVKPHLRQVLPAAHRDIRMQEGAQMAAWICEPLPPVIGVPAPANTTTPSVHRRLMVSQDRHEVYLTVASFDDDYISYIRGHKMTNSFLKMQEYGPFDVCNKDHMRYLGRILLAVSIQGGLV
ncbi:hypothetical protein B0I35DRAFT_474458 [Stachybotrys elegans]|uniref:Uncharacterized protein n=1 Tax=Stachybotrys elegans TaxID=80388 RepID=A0A8K0WV25_9HYPO|nr:hypothetical protein B0I35DRAFT_474458 [Stachybotrys elegans]